MLHRLWLTDEQARTLKRALRAHIETLHKCCRDGSECKNFEIAEKYGEEANALDEILDILED